MTRYVGCVDLHGGAVKQIVGATLVEGGEVATNFVASEGPAYFAGLYKDNAVDGTHVIKLGGGNDAAAREALEAWPQGLQVGGGITLENARSWLEAGASKVIVTSWLFPSQETLDWDRLAALSAAVGPQRLVVDVSCKRVGSGWRVAINKWQTVTECELSAQLFAQLAKYCDEVLVHAADVEGLCRGIDEDLVARLGEWAANLKVVYAGGAKSVSDLDLVQRLSGGRVDLTYGSAVDIFGGEIPFKDLVEWNARHGA